MQLLLDLIPGVELNELFILIGDKLSHLFTKEHFSPTGKLATEFSAPNFFTERISFLTE